MACESAAGLSPPGAHKPSAGLVAIRRPWFIAPALLADSASRPSLSSPAAAARAAGSPERVKRRALHWCRQWLQLVVKYQQNPLRAVRALAHIQVAMHDAWWLCAQSSPSTAEREISAHRAAAGLMAHFYPSETSGLFEAHHRWLAAQLPVSSDALTAAEHIGWQVAQAVLRRSFGDGAQRTWHPGHRPQAFSGIWQATAPVFAANPTEPFAAEWRTWLRSDPARYEPPTAPRPGSAAHQEETQEVMSVAARLTAAQREAAERWHLGAGSVTPAGVWMQHTADLLLRTDASGDVFEGSTGVLTAASIAMTDALVACWRIKYRDWSERPITAIRRDLSPGFTPLLVTPSFPGYVSGHATVSAACAQVLSHAWPAEALALDRMAQEAALSRLWGGIHFSSDNREGLRLGQAVGNEVVEAL